ncbi:SDR family oxidoreductase [Sorangium sp. So ce1151]|uniref:SDR family oxidoreductase n=1 Tax=Sorangium sp. So ce1151 TaxID=3133332 RepID=UPI003F63848B
MNGKVCVVTGGNTGIGKETARGLAQRGARVVLACRDTGRAEAARDDIARTTGSKDVEVMALDLASKASIRAFAEELRAKRGRLDVLVNNAGVWQRSRAATRDGIEATFGVNHVGTSLLTQELLPLLKQSAPSRIVVLSSKLHYRGQMGWDDLQFERRKYGAGAAYSQSKLANVLFTKALARRLEGTGVTVNAVHPGVVATELMREFPKLVVKLFNLFLLTAEQGAACSLHVATAPELAGVTGEYFEKSRILPAATAALDEAAQERLWKLTEALAA